MPYKDYYSVLGVAKTATDDEIKKAYHKLAVKYHPDKQSKDKAANEKFVEINEANQVLSDPEKRKKYDDFGADRNRYEQAGAQQGGFDWSKYASAAGTQNQQMSSEEFESMFAGGGDVDLFELLFGERSTRRQGRNAAAFRGDDLSAETTISLEEAYHGTARLITLNSQTIKVTIPPGIADKQVLRIAKKGLAGINGGPSGDLFLAVKFAPHPEFRRKGNDLHGNFNVDLYTAMLGGKALVKTPKGAVKVDIPKETPNHKIFRLCGLGMPVSNQKNTYGDLFMTVDIQLPDNLTPLETDMFKKLAALRK